MKEEIINLRKAVEEKLNKIITFYNNNYLPARQLIETLEQKSSLSLKEAEELYQAKQDIWRFHQAISIYSQSLRKAVDQLYKKLLAFKHNNLQEIYNGYIIKFKSDCIEVYYQNQLYIRLFAEDNLNYDITDILDTQII